MHLRTILWKSYKNYRSLRVVDLTTHFNPVKWWWRWKAACIPAMRRGYCMVAGRRQCGTKRVLAVVFLVSFDLVNRTALSSYNHGFPAIRGYSYTLTIGKLNSVRRVPTLQYTQCVSLRTLSLCVPEEDLIFSLFDKISRQYTPCGRKTEQVNFTARTSSTRC